jgi:hypothetical protein
LDRHSLIVQRDEAAAAQHIKSSHPNTHAHVGEPQPLAASVGLPSDRSFEPRVGSILMMISPPDWSKRSPSVVPRTSPCMIWPPIFSGPGTVPRIFTVCQGNACAFRAASKRTLNRQRKEARLRRVRSRVRCSSVSSA